MAHRESLRAMVRVLAAQAVVVRSAAETVRSDVVASRLEAANLMSECRALRATVARQRLSRSNV